MTSETTSLLAELKLGNEKIVEGNEKIVTMLKEAQSEERGMSSANADFATTLLRGLGYTVAEERLSEPTVDAAEDEATPFTPFSWGGGEDARTPAALERVKLLLGAEWVKEQKLELVDVRKKKLARLAAAGKRSSGESDLALRDAQPFEFGDNPFATTRGLIELKTDEAEVRQSQLLLQAAALARNCTFGTTVCVLGTDLISKWAIVSFKDKRTLRVSRFADATSAVDAYKALVLKCMAMPISIGPLPSISESGGGSTSGGSYFGGNGGDGGGCGGGGGSSRRHGAVASDEPSPGSGGHGVHHGVGVGRGVTEALEQDLSGCVSAAEQEAFEKDQFLRVFAQQLSDQFGTDVSVPAWALTSV